MPLIEAVTAALGVLNIILIVRRSIWNYPVAMAMVALYGVIFWQANIKSDAGLQVFFFAVNAYGWWAWANNKAETGTIVVERLSPTALYAWVGGSLAAIIFWGTLMNRYTTTSYPYWDGAVAMLSVAAQVLMTRRFLENWWWWIVVNAISMPLYIVKELQLTAGLYGLFLMLAIWGLIEWRSVGADDTNDLPARA